MLIVGSHPVDSPKDLNGNPLHWLNVGSESEISIKELAMKISYLLNFKGEIVWDKNMPDCTKRKKLNPQRLSKLGWKARTCIDDGLRKTIAHFKNELQNKKLRI